VADRRRKRYRARAGQYRSADENRSEETFYQVAFNKQNELVAGSATGNVWLWDLLAVGVAHDLPEGAALQTEVRREARSVSRGGTTVSLLPASNQYRVQSSVRGLTGPIKTPRDSWDAQPAEYRGSTGSKTSDGEWQADHIALSPDGNWLAITPKKGSILLYDLTRPDRDDPRQTDGRPVGAFGVPNATWQRPAIFIDDPQPLLLATPQRGGPTAWYYFRTGSELAKFGREKLPIDIDLTGPTMRVCPFAMPDVVRAELNGNFLPAIAEITRTREPPATDSLQPPAGPRLAEPNRAACGSPT
jgi:hypothetical protein